MNGTIGGHKRVYRGLLRLYPAGYRQAYGDPMVQFFGDQVRDEGASRAWLRAARDVPVSAVAEHARGGRQVGHTLTGPPGRGNQVLGLLGVAGGVALLAAFAVDLGPDLNMIRIFLMLVGSAALVVGTYRRQRPCAPALSTLTAAAALAALTWMLVMEVLLIGRQPPVFGGMFGWTFFWASITWTVTSAVYWLVAVRIGAVTRLGSALVAIGTILGALGIDRLELWREPLWQNLALAGLAMSAIGGILVGLDLLTRRRISVST